MEGHWNDRAQVGVVAASIFCSSRYTGYFSHHSIYKTINFWFFYKTEQSNEANPERGVFIQMSLHPL